ncbi:MAG: zf-HC2 domain-containing protein, partial [Opitutus sp.]
MNCQRVQDSFIDYQDGTLPPDESAALRAHLASCPTCQREWSALQEITRKLDALPEAEPSPRLRENFYAMLETHQREADAPSPFALARGRIDRFFAALLPAQPALQFAFALALLIGGLLTGQHYLARPATVPPAVDAAAQHKIAELEAKVNSMGQLVTYSLLQQQSTSDRLQTVLTSMDVKSPDRKVLTDLVGALAFDPSINVRLSAVEALAQHSDDSLVRAGVLSALPRERAPLVQVAMIELLAGARDLSALPVFEK